MLRRADVVVPARYPFIHYIVYKNGATSISLTTTTAATTTPATTTTAPAVATATTATTTTATTQPPAVNGSSRTSRDSHKNNRVRNHVHKQIMEITKSHGMFGYR